MCVEYGVCNVRCQDGSLERAQERQAVRLRRQGLRQVLLRRQVPQATPGARTRHAQRLRTQSQRSLSLLFPSFPTFAKQLELAFV